MSTVDFCVLPGVDNGVYGNKNDTDNGIWNTHCTKFSCACSYLHFFKYVGEIIVNFGHDTALQIKTCLVCCEDSKLIILKDHLNIQPGILKSEIISDDLNNIECECSKKF